MRQIIFSMLILFFSQSLNAFLEIPKDYIVLPEDMEGASILYSFNVGFFVKEENDLFPILEEYTEFELRGLTRFELLMRLGEVWPVHFRGISFMARITQGEEATRNLLAGEEEMDPELSAYVQETRPPKKKLEVYYAHNYLLGIRIINDEEA